MKHILVFIICCIAYTGLSQTFTSVSISDNLIISQVDSQVANNISLGCDIRLITDDNSHTFIDGVDAGYTVKYYFTMFRIQVVPFVGSYIHFKTCRCHQEDHKYFVGRIGVETLFKLNNKFQIVAADNIACKNANNFNSYNNELYIGLRYKL